MPTSKIFHAATGKPTAFWLDSSIGPKKRKSCSKLIVDNGGIVTDIRTFADFSIYSRPPQRESSKDSVWASLAWIYDSVAQGVLLDVMRYTPKFVPIINISSDSESDMAPGRIRHSDGNGSSNREVPGDRPFTNNEYLALIEFLASEPAGNHEAQIRRFRRMHPERSHKSWSACLRHNREFFNEQVDLLKAGEPFRLVDEFHPGLKFFRSRPRRKRNAFTRKERTAMSKHLAEQDTPKTQQRIWEEFRWKYPHRSTASYMRYFHSHPSLEPDTRDNTPTAERENADNKEGHSGPSIPLSPILLEKLPDPIRPTRLRSADDISPPPVSRKRGQAKSPGWDHSETMQQQTRHSASSHDRGVDGRNHERPLPSASSERKHSRTAEGLKKHPNPNYQNPDGDLLDILSILIMLASESKDPSIDDWIRFANKNAHRSSFSWINFHEKHEKLFLSLIADLDHLEDTASVQNDFSSKEALSLARFLAEEGLNPRPRVWRDFSQEHDSRSLESWVAFKNRFGQSLVRLMREYRL